MALPHEPGPQESLVGPSRMSPPPQQVQGVQVGLSVNSTSRSQLLPGRDDATFRATRVPGVFSQVFLLVYPTRAANRPAGSA